MEFTMSALSSQQLKAFDAACKGDVDRLKECFLGGLDPDTRDDGDTLLHVACSNGHANCVRLLIEKGSNVHAENHGDKETPLECVTWCDSNKLEEIYLLLMENGADINHQDALGRTPLIGALSTEGGNAKAVEALLKYNPDTEVETPDEETAMTYAIVQGRPDILKMLIDAGANVKWVGASRASLLGYAIANISSIEKRIKWEITRLLLENGVNADHGDSDSTVLLHAIRSDDEEIVLQVLAKAKNINYKEKNGNTALKLAREYGMERAVEILQSRGAVE